MSDEPELPPMIQATVRIAALWSSTQTASDGYSDEPRDQRRARIRAIWPRLGMALDDLAEASDGHVDGARAVARAARQEQA